MKLYIARHGATLGLGEQGITQDDERILSPRGIHCTREMGRRLLDMGIRPQWFVSSPLPRAAETVQILAAILNPGVAVEILDVLRPGVFPGSVWDWICLRSPAADGMIVGHMPDVAALAGRCISASGDARIRFKKSAVCGIRFDRGVFDNYGTLAFLLQPLCANPE